MKSHIAIYLISISILCSLSTVSAGEINLLPETLREVSKENHCSQISDFYDRPGPIDPMYVWGYPTTDEDSGSVFWCKNNSAGEKYLLIIWESEKRNPTCPSTIEWMNYPGGLSIIHDEKIPLSRFIYRENLKNSGPASISTNGPIIHNIYDGVGSDFYCHEGQWLFRQFD